MAASMHEDASCTRWEASVADLLDGALPPEEEMRLREHARDCDSCRALLGEAERGRAWARLLHDAPPVPPAGLTARILARVETGAVAGPGMVAGGALVLPHPASVRGEGQARVLMTAAMAFFSLALSWSVSGLRVHDLAPSHVQAAASRQFFGAKKEVVSFYDNLRVIREIEASVETLRKTAAPESPQPSARGSAPAGLLAGNQTALPLPERNTL